MRIPEWATEPQIRRVRQTLKLVQLHLMYCNWAGSAGFYDKLETDLWENERATQEIWHGGTEATLV